MDQLIQRKNIYVLERYSGCPVICTVYTYDKNIPKTGLLHRVHTVGLILHLQSVYLKVSEVGAAISTIG